jgi:hypothetical protein
VPHEQPLAEKRFQVGDVAAYGSRRDAQLFPGRLEALMAGCGLERSQRIEGWQMHRARVASVFLNRMTEKYGRQRAWKGFS